MVHRTARLDRRWARCVRRACTAPPYSVWRRLLCAAHRGRHSRTPNPARCQHVASTPGIGHRLRCCMHAQPPPHRNATWRAAPLLAPTLTKARAAAPRPFRLGGQAARRVRLPLAARTWRPAWSRPAFCRSNAGAPPRVEASAACMPGSAGAGVAEPGRRLRAGTSPWRSCRRDAPKGQVCLGDR